MSAVRMCDGYGCGLIFSENAEGWGVGTMSTSVRDERTRRTSMVQQSIDLCPTCNHGPTEQLAPRVQIAGVPEAERLADTMTNKGDTMISRHVGHNLD